MDSLPTIETLERAMNDIQSRLQLCSGKKLQRAQMIFQKLQNIPDEKCESLFSTIEEMLKAYLIKETPKKQNQNAAQGDLNKILT